MTTEVERHLAYAETQANHPDPQLRPLAGRHLCAEPSEAPGHR